MLDCQNQSYVPKFSRDIIAGGQKIKFHLNFSIPGLFIRADLKKRMLFFFLTKISVYGMEYTESCFKQPCVRGCQSVRRQKDRETEVKRNLMHT